MFYKNFSQYSNLWKLQVCKVSQLGFIFSFLQRSFLVECFGISRVKVIFLGLFLFLVIQVVVFVVQYCLVRILVRGVRLNRRVLRFGGNVVMRMIGGAYDVNVLVFRIFRSFWFFFFWFILCCMQVIELQFQREIIFFY